MDEIVQAIHELTAEVKDLTRTLDHALQCIDYTHDENGKAICGNLDHLTSNVADINDRLLELNYAH